MTFSTANINSLCGSLIVEELIRSGVDYFVVSPGSRSAPLATAVGRNPKAKTIIHFDERGAAFHALGYARATGKPAVLICTSGTAGANYLPAVIEASADMVPLIILTADRPPELRDTGANQTIKQTNLFGDYVRWFFELPCPDKSINPEMVLTTVDQAVYRATRTPSGPVHINCMFREPLAPIDNGEDFRGYLSTISSWLDSQTQYTQYFQSQNELTENSINTISKILSDGDKGIILVGQLQNGSQCDVVQSLADKLKWTLFPDITSGMRLGIKSENAIPYYNLALTSDHVKDKLRPSSVLHIGGRITSKRLIQWLETLPLKAYIHVAHHPFRFDPIHRVTHRIESDISNICNHLSNRITRQKESEFLRQWRNTSQTINTIIDKQLSTTDIITETGIARSLSKILSTQSSLFLASSMPVRNMDIFASSDGSQPQVAANRGVSGIDGTIASTTGFAEGSQKPVTLLIGDLAFLHDLNSLSLLNKLKYPVTIVLINNNGGGIFDHLPIAEFADIHEKFFVTPHDLSFEHVASQFELLYSHPNSIQDFIDYYQKSVQSGKSSLIEISVNRAQNMSFHKKLIHEITHNLDRMFT